MIGTAAQRVIRSKKNPLDISTVVSIFHKRIHEIKPTITPGEFIIEAGSIEQPSILHVGSSSWFKQTGEDEPIMEIPDYSTIVAEAIVSDYCRGILCCDMVERKPGLFFLPGKFSVEEVKTKFKAELDAANHRQRNWYLALVEMGDTLWSRSNGNPRSISEDMRVAAEVLGLKEQKPWMENQVAAALVPCIACGNLRNALYPVCSACNTVVDPDRFATLKLTRVEKK